MPEEKKINLEVLKADFERFEKQIQDRRQLITDYLEGHQDLDDAIERGIRIVPGQEALAEYRRMHDHALRLTRDLEKALQALQIEEGIAKDSQAHKELLAILDELKNLEKNGPEDIHSIDERIANFGVNNPQYISLSKALWMHFQAILMRLQSEQFMQQSLSVLQEDYESAKSKKGQQKKQFVRRWLDALWLMRLTTLPDVFHVHEVEWENAFKDVAGLLDLKQKNGFSLEAYTEKKYLVLPLPSQYIPLEAARLGGRWATLLGALALLVVFGGSVFAANQMKKDTDKNVDGVDNRVQALETLAIDDPRINEVSGKINALAIGQTQAAQEAAATESFAATREARARIAERKQDGTQAAQIVALQATVNALVPTVTPTPTDTPTEPPTPTITPPPTNTPVPSPTEIIPASATAAPSSTPMPTAGPTMEATEKPSPEATQEAEAQVYVSFSSVVRVRNAPWSEVYKPLTGNDLDLSFPVVGYGEADPDPDYPDSGTTTWIQVQFPDSVGWVAAWLQGVSMVSANDLPIRLEDLEQYFGEPQNFVTQ